MQKLDQLLLKNQSAGRAESPPASSHPNALNSEAGRGQYARVHPHPPDWPNVPSQPPTWRGISHGGRTRSWNSDRPCFPLCALLARPSSGSSERETQIQARRASHRGFLGQNGPGPAGSALAAWTAPAPGGASGLSHGLGARAGERVAGVRRVHFQRPYPAAGGSRKPLPLAGSCHGGLDSGSPRPSSSLRTRRGSWTR